MILIVLAAVGVPLWICAIALVILLRRNSWLRNRPGNIPVRIHPPGKERWLPGHGVWVHDVFAFRGSPAAWKEALDGVVQASVRPATPNERKKLRRIGDEPIVATFALSGGGEIEFAARADDRDLLLGSFAQGSNEMGSNAVGAEPRPAPA